MNREEIEKILKMDNPKYNREGIWIFPNQAGGVTIEGECNLVAFQPGQAKEICEVIMAMAEWAQLNYKAGDFIEDISEQGEQS